LIAGPSNWACAGSAATSRTRKSISVSYRPQYVRLNAAEIFFCTSFLVCDPRDIDVLQAPNRLSPIGLSFSRNRTNRVISPTEGYTLFVDLEHASAVTGSDFGYERALAEMTGFFGILEERVVLAARVRGGWLAPKPFHRIAALTPGSDVHIAHPQKRFYAGGANSVRGFSQNQLGPQVASIQLESLLFSSSPEDAPICTPAEIASLECDASSLAEETFFRRPTGGSRLLEGSLEVRFPIWTPLLRGVAFVDFGTVQDGGSVLDLGQSVITPGIGIRYSTPIGPVRVDLAYRGVENSLLPVVTSQVRPFDPATDSESARITGPRGEFLDWVRLEDLALLQPRVVFDREDRGWLRRIQLHLSIGQAF
jgi:outer membrane protein insertion porin family/translocation and assembly module TamA